MSKQNEKSKMLSTSELAVFFESMGMLMRAGITVADCPAIIRQDFSGDPIANAAKKIEAILGVDTFVFSEALEKAGMFPAYAIKAVKVGELSGKQEESFFALNNYYKREFNLFQQIKSAVLSPAVLVAMMAVVMFVTVLWILPILSNVFAQLGLNVNSGGIGVALAVGRIAMGLTGVLLVLVVGLALAVLTSDETRREKLLQLLPGAKSMLQSSAMARIASALGAFLHSGLLPAEAFENATELAGSEMYTKEYETCLQLLKSGEDLGKSLVVSGVFTGFESHILMSATRAGQMDAAMDKIAEMYSAEAERKTDKMLSAIEPMLVGLLTIAISIILIAVLMPLIQMMGAIG